MKTLLLASGLVSCAIAAWPAAQSPGTAAPASSIRRLDGSTISIAEAESFAAKTLTEAHVTGAQLAVLDRGQLVWSAAFRQATPCPFL